MVELDFAVKSARLVYRVVAVDYAGASVVDLDYLVCGSGEALEVVNNVPERSHRVGKRPDKTRESRILTHCDTSEHYEKSAGD